MKSVSIFYNLRDTIIVGDGCKSADITNNKAAYSKYKDYMCLIISKTPAFRVTGTVYNTYVYSVMFGVHGVKNMMRVCFLQNGSGNRAS